MMKEWLIRTKNNHILGPVSRDKIKQLIMNNSLKGDDEICQGNGYWIRIREEDLIQKYITEGKNQFFEADYASQNTSKLKKEEEVHIVLPSEEDLSYPDIPNLESSTDNSKTETTQVLNRDELKLENEEPLVAENTLQEMEVPKNLTSDSEDKQENSENISEILNKVRKDNKVIQSFEEKKQREVYSEELKKKFEPSHGLFGNRKFLFTLILILIFMGLAMLYFRQSLIQKLIEVSDISIISNVHAQELRGLKKKSG